MIRIPFLAAANYSFPNVETALRDPDGLLAGGGDLSEPRLLNAYRHGIFPWYQDGQPILWWSPSVRAIIEPDHLKISRSLRKTLRNKRFAITADTAFAQVIEACAAPRAKSDGTWITDEMQAAYLRLHAHGHAHSIEIWETDTLVGGLYGIGIGACYFGESMFSRTADASKVAFVCLIRHLQAWHYRVIDCQMMTSHLASMGATPLSRDLYIKKLHETLNISEHNQAFTPAHWQLNSDITAQLGD